MEKGLISHHPPPLGRTTPSGSSAFAPKSSVSTTKIGLCFKNRRKKVIHRFKKAKNRLSSRFLSEECNQFVLSQKDQTCFLVAFFAAKPWRALILDGIAICSSARQVAVASVSERTAWCGSGHRRNGRRRVGHTLCEGQSWKFLKRKIKLVRTKHPI